MSNKLAIIVPYRNRKKHLDTFLEHMAGFLETKGPFQYEIFVVEQNDNDLFNRGALLNAGAIVAMKHSCTELCFHDVDMLPEEVDYTVSLGESGPIQLASKVVTLDGQEEHIPFDYFGGVTKISVQDFKDVNGYSNLYEGWGFEDNDFLERCTRNRRVQYSRASCPSTYGIAVRFLGERGITYRQVDSSVKKAKTKKRQLVLYADFVPGYPSKAVGYDDMRLISVCTGETDIGLSFDRYGCCRLSAWDDKYRTISLVTEKVPRIHQRIVGVLDFYLNVLSLYRNGEHIESQTLQGIREIYYDPRSISIGMSENVNRGKKDFFTGDILETGIAVTSEKDREFFKAFSAGEKVDFGPRDFITSYNFENLEGKKGTTAAAIQKSDYIEIGTPILAPGVFKSLPHKESRFDQPEVQKNQDRYFRVMRREIGQNEGLSTVERLYNIETTNMSGSCPLTWVKVTKK